MAKVFHAIRFTKFAIFLIVFVAVLLLLSTQRYNTNSNRRRGGGGFPFPAAEFAFVQIDGDDANGTGNGNANNGNSSSINSWPRTILINADCIANLMANLECTKFPVEVAIFASSNSSIPAIPTSSNNHLKFAWTIDDQLGKDYWLFKEIANSTNSIGMKRFLTKQKTLDFDNGSTQYALEYPQDLAKFRKNWQNGAFKECQIVLKRTEEEQKQRFMPLTMINRAAELSAHMEDGFNLTGILFGGTLLGWRRECSLIPHTGDLDFAIFAHDHSEPFLESLIHSEKFLLKWILGHPKKGLELTLWMDNFKTDIFYLYYNSTRQQSYTTGMRVEKKQRLYWLYPKIEKICTGEMGGHLFHLPCNVDQILEAEYGADGWKKDFPTSQFSYDKSHKNHEDGEFISDEEWKAEYNLYYPKEEHDQTLPKWEDKN